jgi:hypothetical protein
VTPDQRLDLYRALYQCYGQHGASLRMNGEHMAANADLKAWNNLGRKEITNDRQEAP